MHDQDEPELPEWIRLLNEMYEEARRRRSEQYKSRR